MSLKRFTSLHPVADLPQLLAVLETKRPQNGRKSGAGWYTITNLSEAEAEVEIYDEIGAGGVTAADFNRELGGIKAKKITLRVNSPGGNVFDGIAIFNAIRRHAATITAFVDGIAASAASFLIMAADEIVMAPHSGMVIHEAMGLALGAADDMRSMADIMDKSSDNIAAIYATRTGGAVAEWRQRMKDETWFSDAEAVEAGLADRVDGEDDETVAARAAARLRNSAPEPVSASDALAIVQAVRTGTGDVVRKQPTPAFDFVGAFKEGMALSR